MIKTPFWSRLTALIKLFRSPKNQSRSASFSPGSAHLKQRNPNRASRKTWRIWFDWLTLFTRIPATRGNWLWLTPCRWQWTTTCRYWRIRCTRLDSCMSGYWTSIHPPFLHYSLLVWARDWTSNASMSEPFAVLGTVGLLTKGGRLRWSIVKVELPASIARLPGRSACVGVVSPLFRKGASAAWRRVHRCVWVMSFSTQSGRYFPS